MQEWFTSNLITTAWIMGIVFIVYCFLLVSVLMIGFSSQTKSNRDKDRDNFL